MSSGNRATALGLLSRISGAALKDIRPEMELVADLGIDSPKALELLVELEEALGVEIDDREASAMETVEDVLAYAEGVG
jgi:acyl carrier protein